MPAVSHAATLTWLLFLASWLAAPAWAQPVVPEPVPGQASRFERTVVALLAAPDELRADFAEAAVSQLVEVYAGEADLARRESADSLEEADLKNWALAVDRYAGQMSLVRDDIATGYPVELLAAHTPGSAASVVIAGRTVMLTHPRSDQQDALEQAVLRDFCSRRDCSKLLGERSGAAPLPVSASPIAPQWRFGENGPSCSHRGLRVQFRLDRQVARLRSLCEQLFHELNTLETEISWQQRHQVRVDWGQLAVLPVPRRPEHMVRLNTAGDALLLPLPLLAQSPQLLVHVTPWLQQRLRGVAAPPLSLQAQDYAWQQL